MEKHNVNRSLLVTETKVYWGDKNDRRQIMLKRKCETLMPRNMDINMLFHESAT